MAGSSADGDRDDDEGDTPAVYLDVMLGLLTRILRMAGWDVAYALDRGIEADDEIRRQAAREGRVLVTRDRQLAESATESLLLTSRDVNDQIGELRTAGYDVQLTEPTRCANCNGRLREVEPVEAAPEYAPSPDDTQLWRCVDCGQYFWKGRHWRDVKARLGGGSVDEN